jgi:carbonic anhydrase/acetyltransferase-like protein (isoleucine patch superfamily)
MKGDQFTFGPNVRFGQNAVVTGRVEIGQDTSIWHNVILRGDVEPIIIGKACNIQDGTIMHGQLGKYGVTLGDEVSIGHGCILHGCELASRCFIGMGAMVMNGAYIGENILVAAGSLVPEGKRFATPGMLIMGRPAKEVRPLNERELAMITDTPPRYIGYAEQWLSAEIPDFTHKR